MLLRTAFVLLLTTPLILANTQSNFGLGARAMGMGGAQTADVRDFSATYYNPAGLGRARTLELSLDMFYADYKMSVSGSDRAEDAERVDDLVGLTLGLAGRFPFGREDSRFAFGMGIFTPGTSLVGASSTTTGDEPRFSQYGEGQDKIHILPAFSVRIFDSATFDSLDVGTLHIGIGASILADITGEVSPTIDLANSNNQTVDVDFSFDAQWDAAPNFGLLYEPTPWLRFGVAYRGELSLKIDIDIVIQTILARDAMGNITSSIDIPLALEQVALFDPQQVAVGTAIDVIPELTLALDAIWQEWSAFPTQFNVLSSDVIPTPQRVPANFDDIWVIRFGAEWRPWEVLDLRFGYAYHPSPVPEQTGVSNLYDSDRHILTLGVGYAWEDAWQPVKIDAFFQYHHLEERGHTKADPMNEVGSADSGGGIFVLGIGFKFLF